MPSLCNKCYAPGACCRGFGLNGGTFASGMKEEAARDLAKEYNLPFVPMKYDGEKWIWSCPKLGDDGRCTIYHNRPEPCRLFEPASDMLCVHYNGAEYGDNSVSMDVVINEKIEGEWDQWS
jgi:Fe-S-cluster containining protein